MAHSTVWCAGQRYRSCKKRGLTGQKLEALRLAMCSRKRSGSVSEETRRAINEKIALENKKHQAGIR